MEVVVVGKAGCWGDRGMVEACSIGGRLLIASLAHQACVGHYTQVCVVCLKLKHNKVSLKGTWLLCFWESQADAQYTAGHFWTMKRSVRSNQHRRCQADLCAAVKRSHLVRSGNLVEAQHLPPRACSGTEEECECLVKVNVSAGALLGRDLTPQGISLL